MKQKYVISRNNDEGELIVKELGETDPGIFSLLCEQRYKVDTIVELAKEGKDALINGLRSNDFFPPQYFANLLADTLIGIINGEFGDQDNIRVDYNDLDALLVSDIPEVIDIMDDDDDIDALLDDDDELDDTDILDD